MIIRSAARVRRSRGSRRPIVYQEAARGAMRADRQQLRRHVTTAAVAATRAGRSSALRIAGVNPSRGGSAVTRQLLTVRSLMLSHE